MKQSFSFLQSDGLVVCLLCFIAEFNITDDGWIQFNGSQYYINNERLGMEDARASCKKNHSDLVVITGQTERKFIYKQVKDPTKSTTPCLSSVLIGPIFKLSLFYEFTLTDFTRHRGPVLHWNDSGLGQIL